MTCTLDHEEYKTSASESLSNTALAGLTDEQWLCFFQVHPASVGVPFTAITPQAELPVADVCALLVCLMHTVRRARTTNGSDEVIVRTGLLNFFYRMLNTRLVIPEEVEFKSKMVSLLELDIAMMKRKYQSFRWDETELACAMQRCALRKFDLAMESKLARHLSSDQTTAGVEAQV